VPRAFLARGTLGARGGLKINARAVRPRVELKERFVSHGSHAPVASLALWETRDAAAVCLWVEETLAWPF